MQKNLNFYLILFSAITGCMFMLFMDAFFSEKMLFVSLTKCVIAMIICYGYGYFYFWNMDSWYKESAQKFIAFIMGTYVGTIVLICMGHIYDGTATLTLMMISAMLGIVSTRLSRYVYRIRKAIRFRNA